MTEKGASRVVRLPLEDYVLGAAVAEIALADVDERTARLGLAVQAVAARTYAVANVARHGAEGYDLCATTHCQVYRPVEPWMRWERSARRAVEDTRGLVLVTSSSNPRPIRAVFHAHCGGYTSAADSVWPGDRVAYLRAMPDTFCTKLSTSPWQWEIRIDDLKGALERRQHERISKPELLELVERDPAGRVLRVRIGRPPFDLTGTDLRAAVLARYGAQSMRSTRFWVKRDGNRFRFEGSGYGHGVGLCQAGALERARAGRSLDDILTHYFPGTRLARYQADRSGGVFDGRDARSPWAITMLLPLARPHGALWGRP